jgi:hypothetical protein
LASKQVTELVDQVKSVVGRSTATAFVAPETEDRLFLIETLFVTAALFLLNRYFSGFFKSVEKAGERHGQIAIKLLKQLSDMAASERVNDYSMHLIDETLKEAKNLDSPERRAEAEKQVQQILREYGESAAGASTKASAITVAIFGH